MIDLGLPQWQDNLNRIGGGNLFTSNQGYDIVATRLSNARRTAAFARSNATIAGAGFQYPIFVNEVEIDISLAGSIAQSQYTRDFYPRNFVQPNFIVRGQSLDQEDYGFMCDFVRHTQRVLLENKANPYNPAGPGFLRFELASMGILGGRKSGPAVTWKNTRYNQSMKGKHSKISARGYVLSIPRKHEQGKYAPTWEFPLSVVDFDGPWNQSLIDIQRLIDNEKTWVDLLNGTPYIGGTKDQQNLIAEATKNYDWAIKNSVNIFNTFDSGTGTGTGTGTSTGTGSGPSWLVKHSLESLGGSGCSGAIQGDGYSELDNGGGLGSGTALGTLPCGTAMVITNPVNNKSVTTNKQNNGGGSFGSSWSPYVGAAMGLYPSTCTKLGITDNGTVKIQRADGQPLTVKSGFGTKV